MQKTDISIADEKLDILLALTEKLAQKHPLGVVIAMHEFTRHLFAADPYIPLDDTLLPVDRIERVIDHCTSFLNSLAHFGSYFNNDSYATLESIASSRQRTAKVSLDRTQEGATQQVYGSLWDRFELDTFLTEAKTILSDRLENENFSLKSLKGKKVLDMGCGSGRFTIALAQYGPAKVIGFDLGAKAIERAKEITAAHKIENVEFQVGSVLDLPFEDNTFDFIYCNGVLQYTNNIDKGVREFFRVLKKDCPGWLYLYGDGGIVWRAREELNRIMKKIPMEYTLLALDVIGMPKQRFPIPNNWYVPFEMHTKVDYLEKLFNDIGFDHYQRVPGGRAVDFDRLVMSGAPQAEEMYGNGELRYFVWK